jgi:hypothetical protein
MKHKITFLIGIVGVSLFVISSIIGGFLIDNYSVMSQYISESYAIDTEYGKILRIIGYIPSGFLIALFCFVAVRYFQSSKQLKIGFYGIGVFYGLATIVVAIFPCDSGCNKELIDPSSSQLIHNFVGSLTYLFVPIFMILIGSGLKKTSNKWFSLQSILLGALSILFVYMLVANPNSKYIGIYQRMVEMFFVTWIIFCALAIKKSTFNKI